MGEAMLPGQDDVFEAVQPAERAVGEMLRKPWQTPKVIESSIPQTQYNGGLGVDHTPTFGSAGAGSNS
jgi:hypothetical protein